MLFEPEHETRTPKGYLLCDQWISTTIEHPEAYYYLRRVFANRVDCDWIAQNSNRRFKRHLWPFIPKKYIIKFVRANLSAPFMNETFGIPVIHLLRNPYDVLASQEQVKFPWLYDLSRFTNQEKLVQLINSEFSFDLCSAKDLSPLELLALRWCIENVIPLELWTNKGANYEVVKYESLFSDIQIFFDLCSKFNLEPVKNIDEVYKRPSSKTHAKSQLINFKDKERIWTENELKQINTILDLFKTRLYPRLLE